jgi:hypothetical protein
VPTRIDLQRYKKTYPFLRREPRNYFLTESDLANVTIETATASFGGADQLVYSFTKSFGNPPKVTVTPIGSDANFNVFIVSVSTSQVTVKASAPNVGSVHIHAIEVLS